MIKVINSGKNSAEVNMALDENFLEKMVPDDLPILHFYEFEKPAATYGLFLKPEDFFNENHPLDLAKRPTGGGILFHLWDLTFSVLIPRNHPGYSDDVMRNYKYINDLVLVAIADYLEMPVVNLLRECQAPEDEITKHFCFAKPTKYDIMIDGKKVAGAAQRRKLNGYLHQGSISLVAPDFDFLKTLFPINSPVPEAIKAHTFALGAGNLETAKSGLRPLLEKSLRQK